MTENESTENENHREKQENGQQTEGTLTTQVNEDIKSHPVNSLPPSCRRVKLYEIGSSTDTWVDKGTGYCFFDGDLDSENPKLLVSLEQYGIKSVVSTYIKDNSDYSSQNDSIIIWHEGSDTRLYRALSFQNVLGHNACWTYIRNFVDDSNIQPGSSVDVKSSDLSPGSQYRILPVPSVTSVQKLETTLDTFLSQSNISELLYLDLLDKKWLKELFELMHKCIEQEDLHTISSICTILLKLVLNWCGSLELMQILVSDDVFFDLLKSFEYDLDLISQNIRMEHVKFFKKFVRHHEVVELNNSSFYQLIHTNYRINYLKDVILPRHLDEFSIQRINSTVYTNMTEIMNIILTEENNFFLNLKGKLSSNYMAALFLRELLLVTRSSNLVSQGDRNSLILMVRNFQLLNELNGYLDDTSEACKMYKETLLPMNQQSEEYYKNIKNILSKKEKQNFNFNNGKKEEGNLKQNYEENEINREEYRPNLLCTSRHKLIEPLSLVVEIFHICQDIFPAIVRSAVFVDSERYGEPKLLIGFCNILLNVPNEGLQSQMREIISRLLDPKNMDLPEKDEICNIFYDKGVLDYLMHYLTYSTTPTKMSPSKANYPYKYKDKKENENERSYENCNNNNNLSEESETNKSGGYGLDSETSSSERENGNLNENEGNDYLKLEKRRESEEYGGSGDREEGEFYKEDERKVDPRNYKNSDYMEMMVNAKLNIMEILSLCAREHKHRFKLRVQSHKIPLKVIKSSMDPYDKFLVVGSIKFIKVCIQMKDKLVNRHIVRYNLLRYILWILMYKVDRHNNNGSVLESVCLSLLATIESVGTDALIVYLFEDTYCLNIANKFKRYNSCYNLLFTNLQRIYNTINNQTSFDENKWFEEEEDDEEESALINKSKLMQEPMVQENLISLYNSSAGKRKMAEEDSGEDKWILHKKPSSGTNAEGSDSLVDNNGVNKKITVKLKLKEEKSIADEFMMDTEESDTTN